MFNQARIKLTLVYLGIIMAISVSFSAFIYRMVSYEFQRRIDEIETRLELRRFGFLPPPGETRLFIKDIKSAQEKVLLILVYTNVVILVFSSAAGYFLAGITLRPIEEVMEEQKRFIADASHELKTPLTALQTSIEVALRDKNIKLKDALFTLSDSLSDIKNMTNLTNDLLSLAKYQQNGRTINFEKIKLSEVIALSFKKMQAFAKKKKVNIMLDTNDIFVKGDREELDKLFTILLDNAVKYSYAGGEVKVKIFGKRNFGIIEVSDHGIGISKKDIPFIFERFYRSDTSRCKSNTAGFGLGLSIAKTIVDLHKGSIDVESEDGKGTKFRIKIPTT